MLKTLEDFLTNAEKMDTMRLAVAAAQDRESLRAIVEAAEKNIIDPILIGNISEIKKISQELDLKIDHYKLIAAPSLEEAARIAVKLVNMGDADFLMKGLIDTSILLKAVLDKTHGLRTESLLSHVMVYEVPTYHKLLLITDGGMNLQPNLEEKRKITENAIQVLKALGHDTIKVAVLAAKEKVNPKMPATVDADQLKNLVEEGLFGKDVIIDGPLALDLAISTDAAKTKGFQSEVAGDADILLVPNIEMGNGIGKSLTYFANSKSAGIIMGAKAPVVLVSRADSHESKLYSIALGSLIAGTK